jgi:hypothetical protein
MPLSEAVIGALAKTAFDAISAVIARYKRKQGVDEIAKTMLLADDFGTAISRHLKEIKAWSEEISFRDLLSAKQLSSSYVDIDLSVRPARMRGSKDIPDRSYKASQLLSLGQHFVLLGDAGAGKTTTVKKLILDMLHHSGAQKEPVPNNIPILVKLRSFSSSDDLVWSILRVCGIHIKYNADDIPAGTKKEYELGLCMEMLNDLSATVFFDGLDEAPQQSVRKILTDIERMLLQATNAKFILTCRSASYRASLKKVRILELTGLSDDQILEFANKWLGESNGKLFLDDIEKSPYSGAEVRPLMLAQLCAIYERKGEIPKQPKLIYKTIVRLLLTEWDEQRMVKRGSAYEKFSVDQKEEFLEAIAFDMYLQGIRGLFTHSALRQSYKKYHERFGLPAGHEEAVAREIESHTGLIVEFSDSEYQFSHLVIQEYLTAQYVLKLPSLPWESRIILTMPEPLAIAVSLSSHPSAYLIEVIRIAVSQAHLSILEEFSAIFLKRLIAERPLYVTEVAVGVAVVVLFAQSFGPLTKEMDKSWSLECFIDFMKQPEIAGSLKKFAVYWIGSDEKGDLIKIKIDNEKYYRDYELNIDDVLKFDLQKLLPIPKKYVDVLQNKL